MIDIASINSRAGWMIAGYLNNTPRAITRGLVESIQEDPDPAAEEVIWRSLLAGFCGIEPENSPEDMIIEELYLKPGVRRLDPEPFLSDPYFRNIRIPEAELGSWKLTHQRYEPYEAFLRDDIIVTADGRQIPAVGYFAVPFEYPSVMQDGREWMSIKPSETASSAAAVAAAHGNVVTFGLGLGYFTYMAAMKDEVTSVTAVEIDSRAIELFSSFILPQFPEKARNKVKVVCSDAFDWLEGFIKKGVACSFIFADIWHDIADGLPIYRRFREYERRLPATEFSYWAAASLRCADKADTSR